MTLQRLLMLTPFLLGANESALPLDTYKVRIAQELSNGNRFLEVEVEDAVFAINDYQGDKELDLVTKITLQYANKCADNTPFIIIGGTGVWIRGIKDYPERKTELALVERIYSDFIANGTFARTPIPEEKTLRAVENRMIYVEGWQVQMYGSSKATEGGRLVVFGTEERHVGISKKLLGFQVDQVVTLVTLYGTDEYVIFNEATYQRIDISKPLEGMIFANPTIKAQIESQFPKTKPFPEVFPTILDQVTKGPVLIDAKVFPEGVIPSTYYSKYDIEQTAGICKGYILRNKV